MRISARADYAVRAAIEIAARSPDLVKADEIADAQEIPSKFLENILADLRRAGLVRSRRGADGGYQLSGPASDVSIADVIRAVDGPLAWVRDQRPGAIEYGGSAEQLQEVWIAVRSALRGVLENVSLDQVLNHKLPLQVTSLIEDPEAWVD